ncbi:MAG: DUF4097 domain-containing protein [Spirochaetia bacterium]|jgi:DUF4097 and DUF4098 domain-containing protein YvlB|nr:DUF4097 domain-containing protein [Spirochaetia bacterium]
MIRDTKSNKIFMLSVLILVMLLIAYQHHLGNDSKKVEGLEATHIVVSSSAADINIWPDTHAKSITVESSGPGADDLVVQQTGDKLEIKLNDKTWTAAFLSKKTPVINLTVPTSFTDLSIQSLSGNISFFAALNADTISLKATNGNISTEDLKVKDHITISAVNGNIRVPTLDAKDVVIETVHGDIESQKVAVNQLSAKTVSGNIDLDQITKALQVNLHTTTGDISAYTSMPPQQIQAKTGIGSIKINGKDAKSPYQYTTKATGVQFSCTADTGNIELTYPQ